MFTVLDDENRHERQDEECRLMTRRPDSRFTLRARSTTQTANYAVR
jgi:hypothetical protein